MAPHMISAIVLIVIGLTLFLFGVNAKDSISDRFSNFFTGHFTEYTTWLLILGLASGTAGLLRLMPSRKSQNIRGSAGASPSHKVSGRQACLTHFLIALLRRSSG